MKIDAGKLHTFFSKATLDASIPMVLVKIVDKKLLAWSKSIDGTTASNAILLNIDAEDQIWPIKDTQMFLNSLKLFNGVIELQKQDNKLSMFNADRQVDFVLADEQFIDNKLEKYPNVVYEKLVVVSSQIFKNTLKNKGVVKTALAKFVSDGKTLQVIAGEGKFDTITEKINVEFPTATVTLAACADSVFQNLDEKVEVGLKTDYPVLFKFATQEYNIQYVVAHIMDKGE